jgi:hypothetical protein
MGQNRLTLLFKYQIGLNIEFESDLNRVIIEIPFLKTIIAFSKHAKGLELFGRWIG